MASLSIWSSFTNSYIAETIRLLLAPQHKLSCSWWLWQRLCDDLRRRCGAASRESGAFLLGYATGDRRRIVDYVLYDELDPHSLDSGIVRFDGRYFSDLWAICKARGLSVVADIHVHPGVAEQSNSDRNNPMISLNGHVALILPDFAREPIAREDVGIFRYLGRKQWSRVPPAARSAYFHIGL